jgi:hypothetical protein
MWAEKRDEGKVLAVMPSLNDMFMLQGNNPDTIEERIRVVQASRTVELRRLATLEPPPAQDITRAQLSESGDLIIFLSRKDSADWPKGGVKIDRASIKTPFIGDKQSKTRLLEAAIPEGGVLVDFTQMMSPRSH